MRKTNMLLAGILIMLVGLIPFLQERGIIPSSIPNQGLLYSGVVILLGIWVLVYSVSRSY